MRFGRASSVAVIALLTAAGMQACSSARNVGDRKDTLPRPPTVLKVTMADFYFVHSNRIPAGRAVFEVRNAGRYAHQLSLYRLAEDSVAFKEQFRTASALADVPIQNMPALNPGESGSFAVDLASGARYAMASLLFGPDGTNDAQNGMSSELRVGRRAAG